MEGRENDGIVLIRMPHYRTEVSYGRFSRTPLDKTDNCYNEVVIRPGFGDLDGAAEEYR